MKKLNALVIGGSNTVMRPGYLPELPRCLQRFGVDLKIASSLAVGNTSIIMGLMRLKTHIEAIRAADVMLIEYTLNDTSFFAASLDGVAKWTRGFEGVVRFARTINPGLKIVPIIFATQTGVHRSGINPLHGGVHYLANYYGMQAVDVNAALVARFGSDFPDLPGTYQDFAHYQKPIFTTIAAEIIAETAAAYLLSDRQPELLPPKICPTDYAACGVVVQKDVPDLTKDRFHNYLYDETTFDLSSGSVTLEIEKGSILAAKYICVEDSAQLYIEANGQWFQSMTMQPGMVEPKYKFLLSMLNFDLPVVDGLNRITLTGIRPAGVEFKNAPQIGAKPPARAENRLPFAAIMHTGTLRSIRATPAPETAESLEPAV